MIKSQYFCDRCGLDVTKLGERYALYEVMISRPSNNALRMDVCDNCIGEIMDRVKHPHMVYAQTE